MRLLSLSFKNVLHNKSQSITLGIFIFVICFIMGVANSFFTSIEENMQNAINDVFSGDILVRSAENKEGYELFTMKGQWGISGHLTEKELNSIEALLKNNESVIEVSERVRQNVYFIHDNYRVSSMALGVKPGVREFQQTLTLLEGNYITDESSNGVILTEAHAERLHVNIGDEIKAVAQLKNNEWIEKQVVVHGIGNLELLSSFQFPISYMSLSMAKDLKGYNGEVTDVAIYLSSKKASSSVKEALTQFLEENSFSNITISEYRELSGYVIETISIYSSMFDAFIIILFMIVGTLIVNLVVMMGIERRNEIGTLKAIGFSRIQNVVIFQGEIFIITVFSLALGTLASSMVILLFSKIGITSGPPISYLIGSVYYPNFDVTQLLLVISIILGFVLITSFFPSFKISSLKPVEAMKEN
ncbi:ABC transporter permease [Cytobacillus sp. Hm23]